MLPLYRRFFSHQCKRQQSRSYFVNLSTSTNKDISTSNPIKNWKNSLEKGRYFEIQSLSALERVGFSIAHTGNTSDGGIDFKGYWKFPDGKRVEILGQCKHIEQTLPVKHIREFSGSIEVLKRFAITLGCFVSSSPYSPQARSYAAKSSYPMMLLVFDSADQKFQKAYLNRAAQNSIPNLQISPDLVSEEVFFLYNTSNI